VSCPTPEMETSYTGILLVLKLYGLRVRVRTPQCAHSLNVLILCFDIWPDDGSVNRNISPNFNIDYQYMLCY
jgi:hypothetical protein